MNQKSTVRVAIIGAGFSGLGMAAKLKRAGHTDFTVYDRWSGPGGTWFANRYPGAEVDTLSDVYRLSFKPFAWSRNFCQRDELLTYFDHLVTEFDLSSHIKYEHDVVSLEWCEEQGYYKIGFRHGATEYAEVVVSAKGILTEPNRPTWPGLDDFKGVIRHSAEWDESIDLTGKVVAVVGTGSTAISVVPAVAEAVEKLYLFQREPAWILPKPIEFNSGRAMAARGHPLTSKLIRLQALYRMSRFSQGGKAKRVGTAVNLKNRAVAEKFLKESFADRPDLLEKLTPDYPMFAKRVCRSSDFYPALKRDNVELVASPVDHLTETGIVDANGEEHQVDVIIACTGFRAWEILSTFDVTGAGGVDLQERWNGDPRAYLGIAVPDFPNLFVIFGPNTAGSGVQLFVLEAQMDFILRTIKRLKRRKKDRAEVRKKFYTAFNNWLDGQWEDSTMLTANNYFRGPTGRIVTNWPRSFLLYAWMAKLTCYPAMKLTRIRSKKQTSRAVSAPRSDANASVIERTDTTPSTSVGSTSSR